MKNYITQLTEENMYIIHKDGTVYSKYCNRFLKPDIDRDGYAIVTLSINKKSKKIKLHRLIAMLYLNNINNLPDVNHKDNNKLNNHISNLEWTDAVRNNRYKNNKNNSKRYGVWRHLDKWRSRLQFNKKRNIEIGVFSDKEEAYEAFYKTYLAYYGEPPWDKEYNE